MFNYKKIICTLFLVTSSSGLLACGGRGPGDLSLTAEAPYSGTLVRAFVPDVYFQKDDHEYSMSDDRSFFDEGELAWENSENEPHRFYIMSNDRAHWFKSATSSYKSLSWSASALGVQAGDLVDFRSFEFSYMGGGMVALTAVRIVCKFWEEDCIQKERRDYLCEDGGMVIDGKRREDRPCGGWGGAASEEYAYVLGPVSALYGTMDNYFKVHDVPYGHCLITDMSCGHEEGKAIERGKYAEFLERFPNYEAAHRVAQDFVDMRIQNEGDVPFRDWAIYMSKHMFDTKPVELTAKDFGVTRENTCSILDSTWCLYNMESATNH